MKCTIHITEQGLFVSVLVLGNYELVEVINIIYSIYIYNIYMNIYIYNVELSRVDGR